MAAQFLSHAALAERLPKPWTLFLVIAWLALDQTGALGQGNPDPGDAAKKSPPKLKGFRGFMPSFNPSPSGVGGFPGGALGGNLGALGGNPSFGYMGGNSRVIRLSGLGQIG